MALGRTRLGPWVPLAREEDRVAEKRALATALVERVARTCRENGILLGFLIFYTPWELAGPSWRAEVLRETLDRLRVPYLDTAVPLRRALASGTVTLDDLFDATGHHTVRGNEVVVAAIRERWPDLGAPSEPRE